MTPFSRQILLCLVLPFALSAQRLYNEGQERRAQDAVTASALVRDSSVFDKAVANLAEVQRLQQENILVGTRPQMRADIFSWRDWASIQETVKRVLEEINSSSSTSADNEKWKKALTDLAERQKELTASLEALKKKIAGDTWTAFQGSDPDRRSPLVESPGAVEKSLTQCLFVGGEPRCRMQLRMQPAAANREKQFGPLGKELAREKREVWLLLKLEPKSVEGRCMLRECALLGLSGGGPTLLDAPDALADVGPCPEITIRQFFEIPLSSKSRIGHVLAQFAIAFELAFREEHIAKPLMPEVLGDWPDI